MSTNYYFQVYKVNKKTGFRENLITEGTTADFGEKITKRPKAEQKNYIQCKYGYGTSIFLKQV